MILNNRNKLLCLDGIGVALGVSRSRVDFAIKKAGIKPYGVVKRIRLWQENRLQEIKREVENTSSRRKNKSQMDLDDQIIFDVDTHKPKGIVKIDCDGNLLLHAVIKGTD